MNNDVYNKQGTSSLDSAYSKLNEAIKKRNALANNQQYDVDNGVALNTTPLAVNEEQSEEADWFTRTYATGLEAYKNVQRGLLSSFEGVIDFALQLAGIFDKEWAEKAIAYDITDTILKATDVDSHIYRAVTGKELLDQSWLNEANEKIQDTVVSVEQGVGNVIGMLALGKLGGAEGASINLPTFGLMTASGGGQTVEGVFADPNYSGDYLGAVGYGIASGAAEAVIETVSGKVGDVFNSIAAKTGIKALENTAGVFTGNYAGKNFGGRLASMLISSVSEGGEEVLSELADPIAKMIYTKESWGESWQNNFSKEQLDEAFLIGTLTSMITNGGVAIYTVNQARKYGLDAQGNINTATVIELEKVKNEMLYMSNNQGQYSQNEYNNRMTELVKKQLDLGRQLDSTKEGKARNRLDNLLKENQLDSATLQSEEFNKKIEFHTETQSRIDEFKKMIDKVNNNVDFNEQFDVTFKASEEPLKDPDGKPVDGMYNENTKTITFSSKISPTKAFNFLASHELKHHFDTIAELREVNEKILDKIKISGNYETKKAKLIKLGYKEKEADAEMVADYIGELFKKGGDFDFLTMTKEEADLAAQKLAAVRRETSDKYIRARYAEAIAKLRNAETYREPTKAVAYSRSDYDVEIELENPNKDSYIKAKEEFGTTTRINLAGWLNVDGTMLDFSEGQGYRVQDHREIQNIYNDNSWTDALIQYLAEGNIRLQSYGFELWRKPTSQQIEILKRIIRNNNGEIVVDIDINKKGDTNSYEYEEGTPVNKIIEDINNYFDNGIEPVIDRASDYRYSRAEEYSDEYDADGEPLSVQQAEFFKDSKVRDEDGNLMVMYHSSNSKFTVFDLGFVNLNDGKLQGFWFTNNKKQKYSFGDNSISAYINITKPINLEKITLSNLQITKLAEAAGYKNVLTSDEKILRLIKDAELNSDYDIIHYFSPSSNTELFKKYISSVIKITGYDGYILDKYDKGSLYAIAFNSNQIKSIDNLNPTEDSDIRYSKADTEDTGTSIAQTSKVIQKQISNAANFVKDNAGEFSPNTLNELKSLLKLNISKINHTTATNVANDPRTVLVGFNSNIFFDNELLSDSFKEEQKEYLKNAFSFLEERINELDYGGKTIPKINFKEKIKDMPQYENYHDIFKNKTEGQIVADCLRIINNVLNKATNNNITLNGKEVDRKVVTKEEIERQKAFGRDEQKAKKGLLKTIKQIATSIFDGVSYFDVLGHTDSNSIFKDFYEELYTGEIEHLRVKQDFQSDVDKFVKEHKSLVKKFKNKKNKVTIAGKQVYFGEALGFYMALEAENTPSHIFAAERSGMYFTGELGRDVTITQQEFISVLSEDLQTKLKGKDKLKPEEKRELYRECAEELRTKIKEELGKDVDEFVTLLKSKYKKSGEVYQKVSQDSVGFSYPIQDNYYPIKSDIRAFAKQSGTIDTTANYMNNVMNPSFTNKLSKNASNMLRADDVLDTFYHFTNQLAVWSQISTRIKNLDRLLNTTINIQGQKFRDYINDYIDPDFTKRYEALVLSMQGINKNPKTAVDKILNKTRGINATVALSLNAKTVAIQPTAYTKYWLYVSPKNWLKAFATNKGLMDFKELINSSPLTYDRYFGNQGRNIAEAQTVGASQHIGKLGELGMKLISKADEIPLRFGWKAVQLEAMDKGITDKAEIIKMFEKATYETQATYDALSNGSAVRIDNEIAKSFFMFSSENRKTLSRFFHSLYAIGVDKTNKAAWKEFAGSTTAMLTSAAVIALISSALKRLKDDEEEEEFLNMYLKEFSSNMVGVFPIVSNIYNKLVLGYDIQLTGFSQITDLFDIPKYCEQLMETGATEAQKTSAVMQISQRLAHLLGIPFRNIYNDILYLAGLGDLAFDSNMVMKLKNFYYNTDSKTTSTLIKTYSKRNDMEKLSAMIQVRNEKFGAGKTNEKVSNEMARLYNKGVLETFPSQLQSEYSVDGVVHKLNKTQYKQAQDIYSLANEAMELMVVSSQYSGLSDEEKAQAIKKLYGAYYEASKTSVINASEGTKLSKVVKYIDSGKFASYLAKIDGLKASTPTNKKSVVQSYINRLGISKNEKYLLAHLAGYSISDEAKKAVSTYLRSKGMAYKDSNEYFK